MHCHRLIAVAVLATTISSPTHSHAQNEHGNSAYHAEMTAQMAKMDKDMKAIPMSGNPDIDFAAMMIPHHQGAIDMAKVELKYGKDEKLRALATEIIEAQKKEIREMQERIKELQASDSTTTSATPVSASASHH